MSFAAMKDDGTLAWNVCADYLGICRPQIVQRQLRLLDNPCTSTAGMLQMLYSMAVAIEFVALKSRSHCHNQKALSISGILAQNCT